MAHGIRFDLKPESACVRHLLAIDGKQPPQSVCTDDLSAFPISPLRVTDIVKGTFPI